MLRLLTQTCRIIHHPHHRIICIRKDYAIFDLFGIKPLLIIFASNFLRVSSFLLFNSSKKATNFEFFDMVIFFSTL